MEELSTQWVDIIKYIKEDLPDSEIEILACLERAGMLVVKGMPSITQLHLEIQAKIIERAADTVYASLQEDPGLYQYTACTLMRKQLIWDLNRYVKEGYIKSVKK